MVSYSDCIFSVVSCPTFALNTLEAIHLAKYSPNLIRMFYYMNFFLSFPYFNLIKPVKICYSCEQSTAIMALLFLLFHAVNVEH